MKQVIVTDHAFGHVSQERAAAQAAGAVFAECQCRSEDETAQAVQGAHVVLNNFAPMTARALAALAQGGRGAVVIRYGVGVDNVDLCAAHRLGVRVCNVPDYGIEEVADHACAMLLFLARRLGRYDAGIRAGQWDIRTLAAGSLPSLAQSTLGLVGLGRIARALVRRMRGFGLRIIAHDPHIAPADAAEMDVELHPLDALLRSANMVSLHLPLQENTRHLIDRAALARMPRGSILINVSRGGLVDEAALAQALHAGHLAGAALDVFATEPLPSGSPLRTAPNTLFSPHAAFFSDSSVQRLQQLAAEECTRALQGQPLRCALT